MRKLLTFLLVLGAIIALTGMAGALTKFGPSAGFENPGTIKATGLEATSTLKLGDSSITYSMVNDISVNASRINTLYTYSSTNATKVTNALAWLALNNTKANNALVWLALNKTRIDTANTYIGTNATKATNALAWLALNKTRIDNLNTYMGTNATKATNALAWLALNKTRIDSTQTWLGTNVTYLGTNATKANNALSWLALNKTRIDTANTYIGTNATKANNALSWLALNRTRIATLEANDTILIWKVDATSVDGNMFVADDAWEITKIEEVHAIAGNDGGAVSLSVRICDSTEAPASGDAAQSAAFDLKGTANTVQTATLSATKTLADGNRLALDYTGTLTTLAGGTVTVHMKRV